MPETLNSFDKMHGVSEFALAKGSPGFQTPLDSSVQDSAVFEHWTWMELFECAADVHTGNPDSSQHWKLS